MNNKVYIAKTQDPYQGACEVLDGLGFRVTGRKVFIKPNLTGCRPSDEGMGVDTGLVRAVLERLVDCPVITIGESCSKTERSFVKLGYEELKKGFQFPGQIEKRLRRLIFQQFLHGSISNRRVLAGYGFNDSVYCHNFYSVKIIMFSLQSYSVDNKI